MLTVNGFHVTYLQIILSIVFLRTIGVILLFCLLQPLDKGLCLGVDLLAQISTHILPTNFPCPLQQNFLLQNIGIIEYL